MILPYTKWFKLATITYPPSIFKILIFLGDGKYQNVKKGTATLLQLGVNRLCLSNMVQNEEKDALFGILLNPQSILYDQTIFPEYNNSPKFQAVKNSIRISYFLISLLDWSDRYFIK